MSSAATQRHKVSLYAEALDMPSASANSEKREMRQRSTSPPYNKD